MNKRLSEILPKTGVKLYGDPGTEIRGISYDSRNIEKGYLFVALPGKHVQGKDFINDAVPCGGCGGCIRGIY